MGSATFPGSWLYSEGSPAYNGSMRWLQAIILAVLLLGAPPKAEAGLTCDGIPLGGKCDGNILTYCAFDLAAHLGVVQLVFGLALKLWLDQKA